MRDLDIHRRLVANTATVDDVLAIASLPMAQRATHLGHILPLAVHGEPAMRAAALTALSGARGVEGVRAIVARLADDDETVRKAAIDALRAVARDAPGRYVHALFHPREDVRRAALSGELSVALASLAVYLRADPACAELARATRWPDGSLALAVELFAAGHITADELAELLFRATADELRALLEAELHRSPDQVDTYLDRASVAMPGPASGIDVLDRIIEAIATCGRPESPLADLVVAVTARKQRLLARRTAAALLSYLARTPGAAPEIVAAAVALEPRIIGARGFDPAHASAAVRGLLRFEWPVRPSQAEVTKLLAVPAVRADLALATAVVGLLSAKRLRTLGDLLGEEAIVQLLVASDHGWNEICRLPQEHGNLELSWLSWVEKADYKRYVALAGRAIGVFTGKRLEGFIEQMPRRHRPGAFMAALATYATHGRIADVCKAIAGRADRTTLVTLLAAVLTGSLSEPAGKLASELVRAIPARPLGSAVEDLDDDAALRLVALVEASPMPRDHDLSLAAAFAKRTHPVIADWCARIRSTSRAAEPAVLRVIVRRALTSTERGQISRCHARDLHSALGPARAAVVTGLTTALSAREPGPSLPACVALLGCGDPLIDVARELDRFSEASDKFDAALDNDATAWVRVPQLPPLANARLWRWEPHQLQLIEWIEHIGGPLYALQLVDTVHGRLARVTLWQGISEALMFMRYRMREKFLAVDLLPLARYCAERVDKDVGAHAARVVAALVESGAVPIVAVKDTLLDRIADAGAKAREYVARVVRLVGVPEPPRSEAPPPMPFVEKIRSSRDLDELAAWCADPRPSLVQEAALALVVLGAAGQLRLAEVLARFEELAAPIPILATIMLWDHEPALDAVRSLARHHELPPAWQFHLHLSLVARGETNALAAALEAVRAEPRAWYFRRDDWDALIKVANVVTCSLALADAPHHHAYQRAINTLLSLTQPGEEVRAAFLRFLEVDGERPLHLRVAVARKLAEVWGDPTGVPLLAEYIADERASDFLYTLILVPLPAMPAVADMIVSAALVGGQHACTEKRMWQIVDLMRQRKLLAPERLAELDVYILENASTDPIRRNASKFAMSAAATYARVHRVAEVFAWGVRRGVELAGRLFSFHLTSKERELGHTRLDRTRIFVSALPMLRGEPHGQDVVEGLVLHEIGHHVYHRGEEAQKLWDQAHREGIGHFLNLIADEHLERNLRALDSNHGDRLKRLGAYAFHHAPQEITITKLLASLRGSAARALIGSELEVAFDEASVRIRRGTILGELDRHGHPVARFARALRLGLGNRSGDPLIATALAMCGKELRTLDMRGLYELTKRLVELFGGAIRVADVFGGPEGLEFGERDETVHGGEIDDQILQREVERILDPRRSKHPGKTGAIERLQLNVNPDTAFDKITNVVRVTGNAELHRKLAADVHRHSVRLRSFLDELGLRWDPMRARTQGRALDRTRLRALVTRNDPRILIARTPVRKTDLFLGVVIDCSGSMQAGNNIDRARRFAILVAEAVRALPGVEARFFGFTDSKIYDAGSATDCDVVALKADGGNNDAAALYHAANVALGSQKRAKVVVMVSDGLPTECSVAALRALVTELTRRRGIVCAQVAVRKLDEVCFPNYVVLDDAQLDVAVARFGRMIGDLARRSLAQ